MVASPVVFSLYALAARPFQGARRIVRQGAPNMLMLMLAAAASGGLKVDPDSGNNKFDAKFDAPLGEMIVATSSQVACDVSYQGGSASGTCSVPLTSIMVDNEPTKTEHFRQ